MRPLTSQEALDRYFLEARCRILDLAAILDRIDRGGEVPNDPRIGQLRQALDVLRWDKPGRAEQVQMIFSLPYDADWPIPKVRS